MEWELEMQSDLDWSGRFSPEKGPLISNFEGILHASTSFINMPNPRLHSTCILSAGLYILYTPVHAQLKLLAPPEAAASGKDSMFSRSS